MKVGIIGGPESGKSELGEYIAKELCYKLIDGYIPNLSKKLNTAYGPYATHLGNVQIAIERLNAEIEAGEDYVTCGTLVETMAYDALYGLKTFQADNIERAKIATTMEFFGMMMLETYLYDRLYFLKSQDEQLDFQIQYAINVFSLRPMPVTDNYEAVITDIKEWEKTTNELKAAEIDEQGIRPSNSDDGEKWSGSSEVPNVQVGS